MTYRPHEYWPARAKAQGHTYVAHGGRSDSYQKQLSLLTPILQSYSLPPVLDFGCGPHRFRRALGEPYIGVDLIDDFCTIEWDKLSLPRGFGTVSAIYVLQHIVDLAWYEHWLAEIRQSVVDGGRFLVVDHNPMDDGADHMMPRGIGPIKDAGFNLDTFVDLRDGHWFGCFS